MNSIWTQIKNDVNPKSDIFPFFQPLKVLLAKWEYIYASMSMQTLHLAELVFDVYLI